MMNFLPMASSWTRNVVRNVDVQCARDIEGFRQALSGRVTPSVSYQEPRSAAPVYQAPSPAIESAPCPAGTAKQSDGTCLQGGTVTYGGYPTRSTR